MSRILLLGLDPETVDFSDPALPPGMTAEKVHAGIAVALKQFTDRGPHTRPARGTSVATCWQRDLPIRQTSIGRTS